jgi:ribose 5-phosphate isomerase B
MSKAKIWIASDHAGYSLKKMLVETYPMNDWQDLGTDNEESVDYPDFAEKLAMALQDNPNNFGILICGSGQGMVMKANRYPWIRAALCWNVMSAKLARSHNNANVLVLASRMVESHENEDIFEAFLTTSFEGGRHKRRVEKI